MAVAATMGNGSISSDGGLPLYLLTFNGSCHSNESLFNESLCNKTIFNNTTDAAGSAGADVAGCRVARLSSGAEVVVSDLRNPGGPARRALLEVPADGSAGDHLRVSWAPALEDCLAVSGFDGGVQVFSVSTWGPEAREQRALFQHRGHSVLPSERSAPVRTTAHAWHPDRPRTLLSAATDGSVHVWDWVHPGAAQD